MGQREMLQNADARLRAKMLEQELADARMQPEVCQESFECLGMQCEERRTREMEALASAAKLRLQLDETRRARALDMQTLVSKLCRKNGGLQDSPRCQRVSMVSL